MHNLEFEERLLTIYDDYVEHNKISKQDKDFLLISILEEMIPDDLKYKYYLTKIKEKTRYLIDEFTKWSENYIGIKIPLKEYNNFFEKIKKDLTKEIYKDIYIYFHPIVIGNNFTENKKFLMNDEFILNIFATYMCFHTLTKKEFTKVKINYNERMKQISIYDLEDINFQTNSELNIYTMTKDIYNDPRYIYFDESLYDSAVELDNEYYYKQLNNMCNNFSPNYYDFYHNYNK